ncbi:retroviral-like aspartic protease [Candidatus Bathyarchaeota archaeon]|nr:retroviral-like aspartic protease [Candidatus Bathyarchaeota archaeon]
MKYSFDYNPPAPAIKVRFTKPLSDHSIELKAKLDTGADITVLPQHAINELRLMPASRVSILSFDGQEGLKYTYFVDLAFHDYKFSMVEVIGARRHDALLGRDVLNMLKTTLDGKALSFDLSDP